MGASLFVSNNDIEGSLKIAFYSVFEQELN